MKFEEDIFATNLLTNFQARGCTLTTLVVALVTGLWIWIAGESGFLPGWVVLGCFAGTLGVLVIGSMDLYVTVLSMIEGNRKEMRLTVQEDATVILTAPTMKVRFEPAPRWLINEDGSLHRGQLRNWRLARSTRKERRNGAGKKIIQLTFDTGPRGLFRQPVMVATRGGLTSETFDRLLHFLRTEFPTMGPRQLPS